MKFLNCRSNSFIEEEFEYLFLSVDERTTRWYGNSSVWPFGPGELKTKAKAVLLASDTHYSYYPSGIFKIFQTVLSYYPEMKS